MVVDKIDVADFAPLKAENNPPVCPHRDGPLPLAIAGQGVEPVLWQIEISDVGCDIEQAQYLLNPVDQSWR
jgi:hypothetical protein